MARSWLATAGGSARLGTGPRQRVLATCLLAALAAIGGACSSVESRYIGSPQNMEEVGGVPILVQRPRWLKLTYREVYYRPKVVTTTLTYQPPGAPGGTPSVTPIGPGTPGPAPAGPIAPNQGQWVESNAVAYGDEFPTPALKVDQEIVAVGELYALDFKRPLAGNIRGDISFPDKTQTDPRVYQYPTKIGAKVEDKTLKQLNEIVPSLVKKLAGISASTDEGPPQGDVVESRSVLLKVEIYDLNSDSCTPVVCRWCCEPTPPADGTFPHAKVPCAGPSPAPCAGGRGR